MEERYFCCPYIIDLVCTCRGWKKRYTTKMNRFVRCVNDHVRVCTRWTLQEKTEDEYKTTCRLSPKKCVVVGHHHFLKNTVVYVAVALIEFKCTTMLRIHTMSMTKEGIFTRARSHKSFLDGKVSQETFTQLYEIVKWAPTANNSCPLRYVFVSSVEGMDLLHNAAMDGNKAKVESASSAVILAYDINYYEHFPTLAPYMQTPPPQASWDPEDLAKEAIKNAGIQAGFFMAAARAMGLDCGPMAGFHADIIEQEFFPQDSWTYYFVILLGQGDSTKVYPRGKRLSLDDACRFR